MKNNNHLKKIFKEEKNPGKETNLETQLRKKNLEIDHLRRNV
jgi:hypothetical protein